MAHVLTFLGGPYDGEMVTVGMVPKSHPVMQIAEPRRPPYKHSTDAEASAPQSIDDSYTTKVYAAQQDDDGRWWLVRRSREGAV